MAKHSKGFTLVELIIVIVIVGILTIVAVPIFKGYVDKAKQVEAKAMLEQIGSFERTYSVEYDMYYTCATTAFSRVMNIDVRQNKYFTAYYVNAGETSYTAVAINDRDPLTLEGGHARASTFIYSDRE